MRWLFAVFCLSFATLSQATAADPKFWCSSPPTNCN